MRLQTLALVCLLALSVVRPAPAAEPEPDIPPPPCYAVSFYQGVLTPRNFSEIFRRAPALENHLLTAIGASATVHRFAPRLSLELEGLYAAHHGEQRFHEFCGLALLRYQTGWPREGRLSLAVGDGVSYATAMAEYEAERGEATRALNFMILEAEYGHAAMGPWSLVARLHHRSAVFGLIDGAETDSNFYTLGLRYRF